MKNKLIKSALISVFNKDGIDEIVTKLTKADIKIISTGGTKSYIEQLGFEVTSVEDITGYPSILGGRVKTLHPKIFGGILARRENNDDILQTIEMKIPEIDLVIVDLYPFEDTVKKTEKEDEIIEKIDIGGISLIRAAAKNFNDVLIIPSKNYFKDLGDILNQENPQTSIEQRKFFAKEAFKVSSHYDSVIYKYFSQDDFESLKIDINDGMELRYGENPHQKGKFFGKFDDIFEQLFGKQISYNNLLDISSAVDLISEFNEPTVAILKHNNACGIASRKNIVQAWKDALAGDPVSAFGGIIISNKKIELDTAVEINKIFYEVIIAPEYSQEALNELKSKKNRIILVHKGQINNKFLVRSALDGYLVQEKDTKIVSKADFKYVTNLKPTDSEEEDLIFANKIVKNSKSNSIVLVKNKQLIASGVGETSRVDALKHAVEKAKFFKFDLKGTVMSSDAYFPFADSVEIAFNEGITAVIQPGGSIKDKDSIDFCNSKEMKMVFTGFRHFKH